MKNIITEPEKMFKKRKEVLSNEPVQHKQLLLWPGVAIVILQWLVRYIIPEFAPGALYIGVFGGILGGLAVVVWWAFFSRAPKFERWFAPVLMISALAATSQFLDKSIATANMGLMFPAFSVPVLSLAFVVWTVASRRLSNGRVYTLGATGTLNVLDAFNGTVICRMIIFIK